MLLYVQVNLELGNIELGCIAVITNKRGRDIC